MDGSTAGRRFGKEPDRLAFNVFSNRCSSFRLGHAEGQDVWLEGKIVDGEFVFNGRLFMPDGVIGAVLDKFPIGPAPAGWTKRRRLNDRGFELLDQQGEVLFAYRLEGATCFVDVNLYDSSGDLAAHGGRDGLVVHVPYVMALNDAAGR